MLMSPCWKLFQDFFESSTVKKFYDAFKPAEKILSSIKRLNFFKSFASDENKWIKKRHEKKLQIYFHWTKGIFQRGTEIALKLSLKQ